MYLNDEIDVSDCMEMGKDGWMDREIERESLAD